MTCSRLIVTSVAVFVCLQASAQKLKESGVPASVKKTLAARYPHASRLSWEKEDGNYEANWGGKSGEDTSVQFSPAGQFVEFVEAIPVSSLPGSIGAYIKK